MTSSAPSTQGGKRHRIVSPAGSAAKGISVSEELSKGFEKVRANIDTFSETHNVTIELLKSQLDRLEEVYTIQTSSSKRDVVAKNGQVKDLERQLSKLQETASVHSRQLSGVEGRADMWRLKHAEVFKSNQALRETAKIAEEKRTIAEKDLAPHKTRLEDLELLGQRVHDTILRRVDRLAQLYRQMKADGSAAKPRSGVELEIFDQLMVLTGAWETLEDDYLHATDNGNFHLREAHDE